jgi:sugar phosphate permease
LRFSSAVYAEAVRARVFYGWWIVGAMLVALMVGSGLTFWSFTVYIPPLEAEFGWTRAQVSSAFSVGVIVAGVCAPFIGRMIDRVGARRSIAFGSVGLFITFLLFSRVEALWQYLAVFGLQAFFTTWVMGLPFQWLLTQWFVRRRGLALGIATAGFGLGGSVILPLITVFIDRWGWRASYVIAGVLVLAIYLPLAGLLLRNRPAELGLYPDGSSGPPPEALTTGSHGRLWSLSALLRSRQFWLLAMAQTFFFGALDSFALHSVPFFESEGRSATFGATLIAVASLVRTPTRVFAGWALDRLPSLAATAVVIALSQAVCLALLVASTATNTLVVFVVLWGVGGAFGPLLFSLTAARVFGTASFATVSGAMFAVEAPASVVLPPLGGWLFDRQGSYDIAFAVYALAFALAALAWWLFSLMPAPRAETRLQRVEA